MEKNTKLPASMNFLTANPQCWFVIVDAFDLEQRHQERLCLTKIWH